MRVQLRLYKLLKKSCPHFVGVEVQEPYRPLPIVSAPWLAPNELTQPYPSCSIEALLGAGPTY